MVPATDTRTYTSLLSSNNFSPDKDFTINDLFLDTATKYPAKEHARKVVHNLAVNEGVIYLEATKFRLWPNSDQGAPFRQCRSFFYVVPHLSGCELADAALIYDIATDRLTLYIPPLDQESVLWMGLPPSIPDCESKYEADFVKYTTDVPDDLCRYSDLPNYTLSSPKLAKAQMSLSNAIALARVHKDAYEINLLARANLITKKAHTGLYSSLPSASSERQLHGLFVNHLLSKGVFMPAYDPIIASGRSAAILHWVRNDGSLRGKQLLLVDAAAEWGCMAADVTRTVPISGKFSRRAKEVYEIVLEAQTECIKRVRAGVNWDELHLLAHEITIRGLLRLGILRSTLTGENAVKDILKRGTSAAFLPHGLGHLLGLDTHDTGGFLTPSGKDIDLKIISTNCSHGSDHSHQVVPLEGSSVSPELFKYLRLRKPLEEGMVVTVEPGLYFSSFVIAPFLKDPRHREIINENVLEEYWDVGGVRIEDDVLVLENGHINLTGEWGKTPAEVEAMVGRTVPGLVAGGLVEEENWRDD